MLLVIPVEMRLGGNSFKAMEMNALDTSGTRTVLYIDDDPSIISVARIALQMRGFKVLTACDGLEGIEVFKASAHEIDAIVMDEGMPRMRGAECLRAIRELDSAIGALMVSGNISQSVREEALQAGISGFLDKPYHIDDLVGELNRVLAVA
ncbi:MAG: response regulator [Planctomycetota bacterium]|nr:response regulator [Planctomycetota bacterium]